MSLTRHRYTRPMPNRMLRLGRYLFVLVPVLVCAGCAPPGVARAVKPVIDPPPRAEPYPRESLGALSLDGGRCALTGAAGDSDGDVFPGGLGLRGDAGFTPSDLPAAVRCWYEQMWQVIETPRRNSHITGRASSNDLYIYAREINTYLTTMLTALRVTGDLNLLDEVDRLAQNMRAQLDDRWYGAAAFDEGSVDGYLNWVWGQSHSSDHRGRDIHEIDGMRTHSLVAQLAWAFSVNQDLPSPNGVDYAERAAFWLDYLVNHFEAKWRERDDIPWPEFPFLARPHVHETIEFIRYHHYLYLLTGEEPYRQEAGRLSRLIVDNFVEVESPSGPALVTPRSVLSEGGQQDYLIPSTYVRYVYLTAVDLYFQQIGPWSSDETMTKLARSLSEFIIDNGSTDFARDMGGGVTRGGIPASEAGRWVRFQQPRYAISPYALLSPWDESGEVAEVSVAVFSELSTSLRDIYIPVAMMLETAWPVR